MEEELKCKACGASIYECVHFYKTLQLCSKHYRQFKKYGTFIDHNKPDRITVNPWTKDEINILKKYNGCRPKDFDEIAKLVNHPIGAIKSKFFNLGYRTTSSQWTEDEVKLLIEKYPYSTPDELASLFYKNKDAIRNKARTLGLKKVDNYRNSLRKKVNIYKEYADYYKVYTEDEKYYTIIDKDDFDKIKDYYWNMDTFGYFYSFNNKKIILHRFIMNASNPYDVIDHINHKRYDNRKQNLRIVTKTINAYNRGSSDGILRIQEDLFRCFYQEYNKSKYKILYEGSYAECKKHLIERGDVDINIVKEEILYQIPGLFEILTISERQQCMNKLNELLGGENEI